MPALAMSPDDEAHPSAGSGPGLRPRSGPEPASDASPATVAEPVSAPGAGRVATTVPDLEAGSATGSTAAIDTGSEPDDTVDLPLPDALLAPYAGGTLTSARSTRRTTWDDGDDLLDHLADWAPAPTPVGVFRLVPVRTERDLPLLCHWMNDPAVAAFWDLAGPASVTEHHLRRQLDGDGRSVPCLGVLDGTPMSYWEVYRADLDPLARHYPVRPHDTGVHLLIGGAADRGRGIGTLLLRTVADLVLDHRPSCSRVVAEPDLRNTPSVAAFLNAGFRFAAELDLPDKRAALLVRDRALRPLLRPEGR